MQNGLFLVLEGIDGSGTTTQREKLGAYLRDKGIEVHLTAEPSTGPVGELIRSVLRHEKELSAPALALLFAGDRLDHQTREIEPALERGAVVVSDRYVMSSLAYQSLDLPMDWVAEINALAPVPDATFYLRVSPDTARRRMHARGKPLERFEAYELQSRILTAYEEAMRQPSVGRTIVIDAEAGVLQVAIEIQGHVEAILAERDASSD
jgi:dTMP kinase